MSNETKIGILAVVAIALSFWGYKFIMGKNILMKSNVYYAEYANIQQLKPGTTVYINGFPQGSVTDIRLKQENFQTIIITLDMDDYVRIPKDAKAVIAFDSPMGDKSVKIEFDEPCSGADCAESGDYLQGVSRSMVASFLGTDQLSQYIQELTAGLKEVLNSQLGPEADSDLAEAVRDLKATMANLKSTTAQMDQLLARSSGNIQGSLRNLESITANLNQNKDKINSILGNVDTLTQDLSELELKETIAEANKAIDELSNTLSSAREAVDGVQDLVSQVNSGQGSLGKLLKDDQLYTDLDQMSKSIDSLATDFQERPYRYVPFKSRKKVKRHDRKDAAEAANE